MENETRFTYAIVSDAVNKVIIELNLLKQVEIMNTFRAVIGFPDNIYEAKLRNRAVFGKTFIEIVRA